MLVGMDPVEPDAVRIGAVGIDIGERRHVPAGVPFLAARHAGLATHAGVEIDDEPKLLLRRGGKARHRTRSRPRRNWAPKLSQRGFGAVPGGAASDANCGSASRTSLAAHLRKRTRRSNHAACPVIGSAFGRRWPDASAGKASQMAWLSKKPRVPSGASVSSIAAPRRFPIAFQVQTVSGLTPSTTRICPLTLPCELSIQTQSLSPRP